MNKVKIHEFEPGNNGIVATEDIKADELICFIPEELFVTVRMGHDTPIVKYLFEKGYLIDDPRYDDLIL